MRRTGRQAGREAGPEIRPAHRGGSGEIPFGRWSAGRRSVSVARLRTPSDHRTRAPRDGPRKPVRMGLANPFRQGCAGSPGIKHRLPPRGLANPWRLPALHSPSGIRKEGPAVPTPSKTTGRRSFGSALVIPAERNAREPESIDTEFEDGTRTERRGAPCGYGSRLPPPPPPLRGRQRGPPPLFFYLFCPSFPSPPPTAGL